MKLQVHNPSGIRAHRNIKLAQVALHKMTEAVEGSPGQYQKIRKMETDSILTLILLLI